MGWHSAVTLLYTDSTLLKDSLKRALFLPAFAEVSSHFGRPTGQGAGGSSVVVVSKKSGPSVLYRHASFDCALLHHSSQTLHFFLHIELKTLRQQKHYNLLYAVVWHWTHNISEVCPQSQGNEFCQHQSELGSRFLGVWLPNEIRPANTLIAALGRPKQRIQWSCAQTSNPEKLWDN